MVIYGVIIVTGWSWNLNEQELTACFVLYLGYFSAAVLCSYPTSVSDFL